MTEVTEMDINFKGVPEKNGIHKTRRVMKMQSNTDMRENGLVWTVVFFLP
jgi:hypothetical protein